MRIIGNNDSKDGVTKIWMSQRDNSLNDKESRWFLDRHIENKEQVDAPHEHIRMDDIKYHPNRHIQGDKTV